MRLIYLDYAATTPVRPEVLEAMLPYFSETFGNASSIHLVGQRAKKALESARDIVADCIGAEAEEIYFTSGGTESDNLAIKGIAYANRNKGKHIITTRIEHQAVLKCCKYLEEKEGFDVSYLPVDRFGTVDLQALEDALRPDTILVSVMLGNNETGTLQPISEIAHIIRKRGIPFHTDAVQAVGKIPVVVDELGVDLVSISSHKIYGPKGAGALYVRRGTQIGAVLHGGHHERHVRAGTENIPAIVGFSKALEWVKKEMPSTGAHLRALRDRLEQGIRERVENIRINGHPTKRLPHILNVGFEEIRAEWLLLALDMRGIAVSPGAACISGVSEPSHVLQAMGIGLAGVQGNLRFSLGYENNEAEIDFVIKSLSDIIQQVREMEPDIKGR